MVTLKEQVDIKAPYERMEAWANNFQEEFVRWSPYHTECEMYDGGYQKGMKVRFREIVGGLDYNVTELYFRVRRKHCLLRLRARKQLTDAGLFTRRLSDSQNLWWVQSWNFLRLRCFTESGATGSLSGRI